MVAVLGKISSHLGTMAEQPVRPSAPPFTLKEWEEIVFRSVASWEARKREYTRWVAIGVTSAVALLGLMLERIPQVDLGRNMGLSLLLVVLFAYVLQHLGAEALGGRINKALLIIVAAEEVPESPWKVLKALFKIAEISPKQFLRSPITGSILVTMLMILETANLWPEHLATLLLALGTWRTVWWLVFFAFFLRMRRSGRELLPQRDKLLAEAPREYPLDYRRKYEKVAPVFALLPIGYYVVQLSLLVWMIWSAVPLTYQLLQMVLPLIGIAVLASYLNDVAWPLVKGSSEVFGKLRDLHSDIVMGNLSTTDSVWARVVALEKKVEDAREDQFVL